MKKQKVLFVALACVLMLVGCGGRSMNDIISNEPSVTGIVEEVHSGYVLLYSEEAAGYPNGSYWSVPLNAENPDSYTDVVVGDEIVVYFDGNVMETYPLQIGSVYAITLKTPADRGVNENP